MNYIRSHLRGQGVKVHRQSGYPGQTANWIQDEFASIDLGDKRLDQRFFSILESFSSQPDASIPQSSGSWDKTKGAYRFMDNPKVTPIKILTPHYEATTSRIREEKVILAVQDTSCLNYTHHPETKGLGNIGTDPKLRGMLLHSTLAFTPQRTPLGLIDQLVWTRPPKEYGKRHQRFEKPIDEKESHKWLSSLQATEEIQKESPDTLLINVGDREADIYELFLQAQSCQSHLLVRAAWDRRVDHPEKYLWAYLEAQPLAITLSVIIPRRKVLKSGCNIEKHQLKTAERLINCLAIDAIVAWRVMFLTMMGRSVPDLPCTVLFEEHEWKALYCFANKTQKPPEQPPSLGEAVSLVAKLGGFLGRKSDGYPGVQVLWRGMKIVSVISGAWTAFGPESTSLPGLS